MKQRSNQQNKSLHLFFELLANELNMAGLDMKKVLKPTVDIPWTKTTIKEHLWKPLQNAYNLKKSTTELTTAEVSQIYDVLNRHLGEKFSIHVPFPSEEQTEEYLNSYES